MKSFLEFLIENNSEKNFIWAVNGDGNLMTAPPHEDHFVFDLYFGHDYHAHLGGWDGKVPDDSRVARSWGRVDDGVATIVTRKGAWSSDWNSREQFSSKFGRRNKRSLEDDIFHRIHAIEQLEKFPGIMFHAGAEDGKATLHSPTQHKKYLTSFLGGD